MIAVSAMTSDGCSSSYESSRFTFDPGSYKFSMTDSTGAKLADGTLTLKTKSSGNISGSYAFTKVYRNDFPGKSSMDGEFQGTISADNKVFINTNPRIADSNVFWNMELKKSSLTGDWVYSVFRGTGNKGKIKITK